jgi:hypothetical protein
MADDFPAEDTVELGASRFRRPDWLPSWRPSGAVVAAGALLVGLAAGYVAGTKHVSGGGAQPAPSGAAAPSSLAASAPAAQFTFADQVSLSQTTGACSEQTAGVLELGVEITNQSATALTLQSVTAVLPLGGLKQVSSQWEPCGALPSALAADPEEVILMPGNSTWLTVSFQVSRRCPTASPVQFNVKFLAGGQERAYGAILPGFADLSQVSFSSCQPSAAAASAQPAASAH